jgi:hypothetical protein
VNADGSYNQQFIDDFFRHGIKQHVLLMKLGDSRAGTAPGELGARDKIYIGNIDKLTGETLVS